MEQTAGTLNLPPPVRSDTPGKGLTVEAAGGGPNPYAVWCYTGGERIEFCPPSKPFEVEDPTNPGASLSSIYPPNREAWPKPEPVESCSPEYKVVHCLCRAKVVDCGCNRSDCRRCQFFLRTRSAASIKERMEPDGYQRAVLYTTFTTPEVARAAAADPKTWSKWRRQMWRWIKKNAGGLYAVERTDPAGRCDLAQDKQTLGFRAYLAAHQERDPGKQEQLMEVARRCAEFSCDCDKCTKWHPHLNLLWVQRPGWPSLLSKELLAKMKAAWAEIIGLEPEVDVFGNVTPAVVLVEHQYAAGDSEKAVAKRLHWYSYLGRKWPDWRRSVPKHLTVRWLGSYPRRKQEDEHPEVCDDCGAAFETVSFGTREKAEALCRAGPHAARQEVKARRRAKFELSRESIHSMAAYPKGRLRGIA